MSWNPTLAAISPKSALNIEACRRTVENTLGSVGKKACLSIIPIPLYRDIDRNKLAQQHIYQVAIPKR